MLYMMEKSQNKDEEEEIEDNKGRKIWNIKASCIL